MLQDEPKKESNVLGMLYLIMLVVYLTLSLGRNLLSGKGIEPPVELLLVLSELVFLIPALIYVLARRLSFKEDLGFRPIKAGTFFMCLLLTLLVSPMATFFNVLSKLFVENTMIRIVIDGAEEEIELDG